MTDIQQLADRMEIEALRGEFTDAVMMNDHDRLASLFTDDGAVRIPDAGLEAVGHEQLSGLGRNREATMEFFIQNTHPGSVRIDGNTASGRVYLCELARFADGESHLNYAVYHDRYARTADGWKFAERRYEIRYVDTTPLAGSPASRPSVAR